MKATIYMDSQGQWRWRIRARNGKIIADGGEGYANKANAMRAWVRFATVMLEEIKVEVIDA